MMNRLFKVLGSVSLLVAVAAVSSATWLLIEQPETPDALR